VINYPKRQSEFEVQSHLYEALKAVGLNVRGEVKHEHCRFDLVIYDKENNPICIIEVKGRGKENYMERFKHTKRYSKYSSYNVPILVCRNDSDVLPTLNQISKLLKERK